MSLIDEAGSTPRSKQLLPIALGTFFNALGGVVAQVVERIGKDAFPKYAMGGDLLVIVVAVAARYFFAGGKGPLETVVREVGSGMAGYSGADLWQALKDRMGWGVDAYKALTPYKMGSKVRYNGKTWTASGDISASDTGPGSMPGADPRWVLAQGIEPELLRDVTQMLLRDEHFVDTLAQAQVALIQPELDRMGKEGKIVFEGPALGELAQGLRASLRTVANEFQNLAA